MHFDLAIFNLFIFRKIKVPWFHNIHVFRKPLQCTLIALFTINDVFFFDTSFSRGTYNSSKLIIVRIPYRTANFVAAVINICIKRRARNNADAVTAMTKTIASLPCP